MALIRWSPVGELASMEIASLNRMFSDFYGGHFGGWVPPVDIYETDAREVVIRAELPDMKREDIGITLENDVLTLKGERSVPSEVREEGFHRRERRYGSFTRAFTLPNTVDVGRISATYKDGVLTIRLPQREEAKPKQIVVGE
jgi:HSP20 family protein